MKKIFLSLLFIAVFCCYGFAQNTSSLVSAFKSGKIENLADMLNGRIELIIEPNNIDDTYTDSQAIEQVQLFLQTHKPTNFSIKHEGQQNGAKFVIGTLTTAAGTFRVTTTIKNNKINEITIEK